MFILNHRRVPFDFDGADHLVIFEKTAAQSFQGWKDQPDKMGPGVNREHPLILPRPNFELMWFCESFCQAQQKLPSPLMDLFSPTGLGLVYSGP